MEWLKVHWLACLLLLVYTAILIRNAWIGRQASTGMDAYYVGNRSMGGIAIGISFYATFASTNSYIGHAGKSYAYGLPWVSFALALVAFTYISWRFIAPKLRAFAANFDALTLPDYLGARFCGEADHDRQPLRLASAVIIIFSSLLYLVAIFKGAGHLFQQFLNIPYESAVLLTLVIVVIYTSAGGFISVVRTDVMQGILMVIGAVLLFYFVTEAAGGVGAIGELASQPDKSYLFEWNGGISFAFLIGLSLSGALKLIVDPRQLSRFYALKNDEEAKRGIWIAMIGLLLVQLSIFPIGLYSHFLLEDVTDTDLIVPTLLNAPEIFPIWAADFLTVAIVAAAMSSMDSVLLVAASTSFKNLIRPLHPTKAELGWTRSLVMVIAVLAAALALNPPGDIVEITIFSGSLYAVCFLPAVVLGLHWQRGNSRAVMWSMTLGTLVLIIWMLSGLRSQLHEVFPALMVSVSVYVAISLYGQPSPVLRAP